MVLVTKVIIYLTKNENKSSYMKIFMIGIFYIALFYIFYTIYIYNKGNVCLKKYQEK